MSSRSYLTVARIRNESGSDLRLYLEMLGTEVVLAPGHDVELLAGQSEGVIPITIDYVTGGLQVHPHTQFDPDWHVRFREKVIPVNGVTVLAEHGA